MVLKCDVSGERDFVGEDVVVADHAVVCDVNANHKKVARADTRRFTFAVRAMKGAKLANHIVVANLEMAPLTLELQILRLATEDRMFKNPVPRADFRKPLYDRVGANLTIWANFDFILDYGCGMNGHFLQDLQGFQGVQDNRVLWILQILFMMLGCLAFFAGGDRAVV